MARLWRRTWKFGAIACASSSNHGPVNAESDARSQERVTSFLRPTIPQGQRAGVPHDVTHWRARVQQLHDRISQRGTPLCAGDEGEVRMLIQSVCASMAQSGMECHTPVTASDLYTKVWLYGGLAEPKGSHVTITAQFYNTPPVKPIPHTHSFNFFSFCADGHYEHWYYRRRQGADQATWYCASRPAVDRGTTKKTQGHELNFEVVLQDVQMHLRGDLYFIDHRVIHDVTKPAHGTVTLLVGSNFVGSSEFYTDTKDFHWSALANELSPEEAEHTRKHVAQQLGVHAHSFTRHYNLEDDLAGLGRKSEISVFHGQNLQELMDSKSQNDSIKQWFPVVYEYCRPKATGLGNITEEMEKFGEELLSPTSELAPIVASALNYVKNLQLIADGSKNADDYKLAWEHVKQLVEGESWKSYCDQIQYLQAEVPVDTDPYLFGNQIPDGSRAHAVLIDERYHSMVKARFDQRYWMMFGDDNRHLVHFLHDNDGKLLLGQARPSMEARLKMANAIFPRSGQYACCCTSPIVQFAKRIEVFMSPNLNPNPAGTKIFMKVTHQGPQLTLPNGQVGPNVGNTRREWTFSFCMEDESGPYAEDIARLACCDGVPFLAPLYNVAKTDASIGHLFRQATGSTFKFDEVVQRALAYSRVLDRHGDPFMQPMTQSLANSLKQDFSSLRPKLVKQDPRNVHDVEELNILPAEWFDANVVLRTLDLVDRCNYSVLVIIGLPSCVNNPTREGVGVPAVPIGRCTRDAVVEDWNTKEARHAMDKGECQPFDTHKIGKYTVFQDLPQRALDHWEKDGAVIVDPRDGMVLGVTLEVLPSSATSAKGTIGGMRKKTAEVVTTEALCISILKKKKPDSPDGKVKRGIVSIRSSSWAHAAIKRGLVIEPIEYVCEKEKRRDPHVGVLSKEEMQQKSNFKNFTPQQFKDHWESLEVELGARCASIGKVCKEKFKPGDSLNERKDDIPRHEA